VSPLQTAGNAQLRRATSRTRTARHPLAVPTITAVSVTHPGSVVEAYAGAVALAPASELFPGHSAVLPFTDAAVQLRMIVDRADDAVVMLLDLGQNYDVARIELYGNALQPPIDAGRRPQHNFALPRAVAFAASEEEFAEFDLHRRSETGVFPGDIAEGWRTRWISRDFRGLWGWTPIVPPPTFGRYLAFAFGDLPRIATLGDAPLWGVDIQRLVVYPFLDDADHRPHVEHSVVASRQAQYVMPSNYWARVGVAAPVPADHQSIGADDDNDALLLPSALSGMGDLSPMVGEVALYASAPVPLDPAQDNRVFLVTQATTDEVPVLDGVNLVFRVPAESKTYHGPKLPSWPDYLISVHVTNDREAAFSADPTHPSWRLAADERLVSASSLDAERLGFVEPIRARWVRITARPLAPQGIDLGGAAALLLHRVDLLRCRDWWLAPEPNEDLQVDTVLLRIRGVRLLDDYAFMDGQHGVGVTIEARSDAGPFERIRSFRTLVELMEDTQHRVFANHRRADKPVQHYKERNDSRTDSHVESTIASTADTRATIDPGFGNRQVTRTGTLTTHTDRPRDNLGGAAFASLPNAAAHGLTTTRTFEVNMDDVAPPQIDIASGDMNAIVATIAGWGRDLANQGAPVSLGVGGNLGGNFGASAGVQFGGSLGFGINIGTQLGGGVTHSVVTGDQGSVVQSETLVVESQSRQQTSAKSRSTTDSAARGKDRREVWRWDLSAEVRRRGLEVRYGGVDEDLLLAAVPVARLLRGFPTSVGNPALPQPARDVLRVRIDHLPRGVRMDVEFRGRILPRERKP
jgi:hypothetical protein